MENLYNKQGQGAISESESDLASKLAKSLSRAASNNAKISVKQGQGAISDSDAYNQKKAVKSGQGAMTRDEMIKQGLISVADSNK